MDPNKTVLFGHKLKWDNYAQYFQRHSSFETLPQQLQQDKITLARAGFIYSKEGDIVECFACGVRIN